MHTATVRYEVRYIAGQEDVMFFPAVTILACARRSEAHDMARELANDPQNRMVEAWQIGTDGGDPAIATALVWSRNLAA